VIISETDWRWLPTLTATVQSLGDCTPVREKAAHQGITQRAHNLGDIPISSIG